MMIRCTPYGKYARAPFLFVVVYVAVPIHSPLVLFQETLTDVATMTLFLMVIESSR